MSDLLNQASLVMVPSGYKEDTVYSVVPSDGSGDLSFTRASNGTRINSAGLVEVCPWNLLEQSNNFSISASWLNDGTTETGGQAGYDGTNNAWLLIPSTIDTYHTIKNSFSEIGVVTYSVYAKAQTYNGILFFSGQSGNGKFFNLSNGTLGDNFGTGLISSSIESVGNGWYRCSMTVNRTAAGTFEILVSSDGISTYSFAGNGTGGVFIQNAQANIGSTAKPYFPTTDRLNVPRLTYQNGGGGCPSLLLEKQSTNLILQSEVFDNASWTKADVTVTANAITSPDGTQNADKLIESATTASHYISQASATSASVVTTSVFLKQSELRYAVVFISNTVNKNFAVLFDLQLGVVVTNFTSISSYAAPTSSSIENYGNGWFRCIVTATDTFTNASCAVALNRSGADSGFIYTGDGTSGFYIWGAQLEASSYPTSLINTTSSSATRVADACFKTGISSLIGQTEGTIFVDVENNETEGACIISTNAGGGSGSHIYLGQNNNNLALYIRDAFTYSVIDANIASIIGRKKIALAYGASFARIYMNGTQIYNSTSAVIPSGLDRIEMNNFVSTDIGSVKFNEVVYFQTKLTNAELASLTTI